MTKAKQFRIGGHGVARDAYQYRACGLDDVYLLNGFTPEETAYGRGVSIQNVEDLHKAIGLRLISDSRPLTAREMRFLRKQMGFSQEQLAARLRVDAQTIARYEKDQTGIPGPSDGMVRMLYAIYLIPADRRTAVLEELAEALEDQSDSSRGAMYFRQTNHGWDDEFASN